MGGARPWLLVSGIILLATVLAYLASLEPPPDSAKPSDAGRVVYRSGTWPLEFSTIDDFGTERDLQMNTEPNVTEITVTGEVETDGARDSGRIFLKLVADLNGLRNESLPIEIYECAGTTPSGPVLFECTPEDSKIFVRFLQSWNVTSHNGSSEPRPDLVGVWRFDLVAWGVEDAEFDRIDTELRLHYRSFAAPRDEA